MARIGFRKAKYNLVDAETGKYETLGSGGKVPEFEKVVDEKFAPEYNSAELYANDGLCESDYSFKSGTLTLTVADDEDVFCAKLLGNSVSTTPTEGQIVQNNEDIAPYVGYGHIIPKVVNGVKKYKVEFFPRVKFSSITSEAQTRGDGTEFKTTSIEGKVFACDVAIGKAKVGDWEMHKTFTTLTEAETYLDGLLTPES